MAHEILVPQPRSNLCPLHWKHEVLSTGPPGNSLLGVLKPTVGTECLQYHRVGLNSRAITVSSPTPKLCPSQWAFFILKWSLFNPEWELNSSYMKTKHFWLPIWLSSWPFVFTQSAFLTNWSDRNWYCRKLEIKTNNHIKKKKKKKHIGLAFEELNRLLASKTQFFALNPPPSKSYHWKSSPGT